MRCDPCPPNILYHITPPPCISYHIIRPFPCHVIGRRKCTIIVKTSRHVSRKHTQGRLPTPPIPSNSQRCSMVQLEHSAPPGAAVKGVRIFSTPDSVESPSPPQTMALLSYCRFLALIGLITSSTPSRTSFGPLIIWRSSCVRLSRLRSLNSRGRFWMPSRRLPREEALRTLSLLARRCRLRERQNGCLGLSSFLGQALSNMLSLRLSDSPLGRRRITLKFPLGVRRIVRLSGPSELSAGKNSSSRVGKIAKVRFILALRLLTGLRGRLATRGYR